jgi:hypothetical protein
MTVAGESLHRREQLLGRGMIAGRDLVMRTLAGQQRPRPADSDAVERPAVHMLAIAVAVVTMPARSGRQLDLQQGIDYTQRIADTRIVRCAQAEAHQRQCVGTDQQRRRLAALIGRAILDRHKTTARRARIGSIGGRDAHVVALDADLARQRRIGDIDPALDLLVPRIGGLAQIGSRRGFAGVIGDIGGRQ